MSDIIKSLGLYIENEGLPGAYVSAHDLREALYKLPVVTGISYVDGEVAWNNKPHENDTHKARLLGVEKIVKEPLRMEFKTHLEAALFPGAETSKIINAFAGKRVKLVVTEIQEGE